MDADKLAAYAKSLEEEYALIDSGDTAAVIKNAKKRVLDAVIDLSEELVDLAKNADSESVRLQAIKFGLEWVSPNTGKNGENPLEELFNRLTAPEPSEKAE